MGERVATERGSAALRSPISWGLLGLVIERPSYGYELVQRFERTYADTLELSSPSQIYTALDTLAGKALIEEMPAESVPSAAGRQPKLNYRATGKGVRSYEEWLVARISDEHPRSQLFARQLAVLPAQTALGIVERCERMCLEMAGRTPPPGDASVQAGGLAARLLWEEGRLAVRARLAWLEYARRELSAQISAGTPAP